MDAALPEPRITTTATAAVSVEDLSNREGFDEQFLGRRVSVPSLDDVDTILLPYTHFSVLMRPDKRLAAITALGIDGGKFMDLGRSGIDWRLDPRLRQDQQAGERVYARNDLDRGHLVRRASAVWGDTRTDASRANEDTFTTPTPHRRLPSSTRPRAVAGFGDVSAGERRRLWPAPDRVRRMHLQ